MITFKQFLAEEEPIDLNELLNTECHSFFQQTDGQAVLYRGIVQLKNLAGKVMVGNRPVDYYRMTVRKDRAPMTMARPLSEIVDNFFQKKFGFKARSEAFFCYGMGAERYARQYGNHPCVVFPIGPFNCVWSPKAPDLWDEISAVSPSEYYSNEDGYQEDKVEKILNDLGYRDDEFDKAAAGRVELMIECDEYIAIPYGSNKHITAYEIRQAIGIEA